MSSVCKNQGCNSSNTCCDTNSSFRDDTGVWKCKMICWNCKNQYGHVGIIVSESIECPYTPKDSIDHISSRTPTSRTVIFDGNVMNVIQKTH